MSHGFWGYLRWQLYCMCQKQLFKMRPLHVDVSPLLQQVSEARGGVGRALGGQDHVNRPATLEITAVDPPLSGLHQEPNGG